MNPECRLQHSSEWCKARKDGTVVRASRYEIVLNDVGYSSRAEVTPPAGRGCIRGLAADTQREPGDNSEELRGDEDGG